MSSLACAAGTVSPDLRSCSSVRGWPARRDATIERADDDQGNSTIRLRRSEATRDRDRPDSRQLLLFVRNCDSPHVLHRRSVCGRPRRLGARAVGVALASGGGASMVATSACFGGSTAARGVALRRTATGLSNARGECYLGSARRTRACNHLEPRSPRTLLSRRGVACRLRAHVSPGYDPTAPLRRGRTL